MNEKCYDYSVGLNTPYWIQEIRTRRGKLITYFSTPMELSFFIVFAMVLVGLIFLSPFMKLLATFSFGISNLLYGYAPYRLARLYCEFEPDGKKMHVFLLDSFKYLCEFSLNSKAIYQGERVTKPVEVIQFEQLKL